jgi:hypothetical protein
VVAELYSVPRACSSRMLIRHADEITLDRLVALPTKLKGKSSNSLIRGLRVTDLKLGGKLRVTRRRGASPFASMK